MGKEDKGKRPDKKGEGERRALTKRKKRRKRKGGIKIKRRGKWKGKEIGKQEEKE